MNFISKLLKYIRNKRIILFLLFTGLLIFTRFYNLDYTARFTEDESKDLVGIHQIYVDKKITLVGPTNEQGTKVFSSLTFYMLLPAAILGHFDPASTAYGMAFWGVVTAILILYLTKQTNSKLVPLVAILLVIWFPLLETSRWAWNPNLIPLWVTLALIFYKSNNKWLLILTGLFLGLSVHSHYYSIFAAVIFLLTISLILLIKKHFSGIFLAWFGFVAVLSPFVIFDLRHPPGIFLTGLISESGSIGGGIDMAKIVLNVFGNFSFLMHFYTQSGILAVILAILSLLLFFRDIKKKDLSIIFLIPWILQCVAVAFLPEQAARYLIPGLLFFFVWVISERRGLGKILSALILLTLIVGGAFSVYVQLTSSTWPPPIPVVREISNIVENDIRSKDLKNVNIAVLDSPDHNTEGKKYRDVLLVLGDNNILTKNEYFTSDHLFVISTAKEEVIRADPAVEMTKFRSGRLLESIPVDSSGWYVYHFIRNM